VSAAEPDLMATTEAQNDIQRIETLLSTLAAKEKLKRAV